MIDRLQEACAGELERLLEGLFESPRMISPGSGIAEVPITGGWYIPRLLDAQKQVLLLRIVAALVARERVRADASVPPWAKPLVVHQDRLEEMIEDDNPQIKLAGYYGSSLRGAAWDYDAHPSFNAFASGIMACEYAPIELRNDPLLLQQFPPRPLEGLCDGQLMWRSATEIAMDRENLARIAAYEAHMGR
jgi:hypothetical protein